MLSSSDIRTMLQDVPEKNKLIDEKEFSDSEIQEGFRQALSSFNSIPPLSIRTDGKDSSVRSILTTGILAHLYRTKSLQQIRNQLSFSDGGAAGSIDDKGPAYLQAAQYLEQQFERTAQSWKRAKNEVLGYGYVGSDYDTLPNY